jgi:hypothetical protein
MAVSVPPPKRSGTRSDPIAIEEYPRIQTFRIWNPATKSFTYSAATPMMLVTFFSLTAPLHSVHKMPYQRSTSVFDKNGREIYEGDIVSYEEPHFEGEILTSEVVFRDGCLGPVHKCGGERFYAISMLKEPEIMGNIYETPELLK